MKHYMCQSYCNRFLEKAELQMENRPFLEEAIYCSKCKRYHDSEFCFQSHKVEKLFGKFKTYWDFLSSLKNCMNCLNNFELSLKCGHYGKRKRNERSIVDD